MADSPQREQWGTRLGLVLAAAGNAIGIGNLLRFPGQAGQNGGGAFMIPYVVSLIVFGLPMMWVAWTIGRIGGRHGHGSTPGMFDRMWRNPAAKYLGVIGVALPLIFVLYYTYIEAWCLAYSWFSLTGEFLTTSARKVDLQMFLQEFLGDTSTHSYFPGQMTAFSFLLVVLGLNVWILYRGVARGIELLAKIAVPLLLLFCLILVVRVFTLGEIKGSAWDGLAFLWTPDFSALAKPSVWLAAAGQIFFTLSIGFGSLECYASYVRQNDDIALAGLTTTSTNEFVEVIFGSLIAIPAAAIFFGAAEVENIAKGGTFFIGMISMPEILRSLPGSQFFGSVWFLLLFFAAFTSSVAVAQPVMAFFQDEGRLRRGVSATLLGLFWLLGTVPVIFFYKYGVLDEMDFWAGTVGLVVFSTVEIIIFVYIYKLDRGWKDLHEGAQLQVPTVFKFIMRYVTPVALLAILVGWSWDAWVNRTLVPQPRFLWSVTERSSYPGDFVRKPDPAVPSSERDAQTADFEQTVRQAVETARRDLSAWAIVRFDGAGGLEVTDLAGDPRLMKVVDAPGLAAYLRAVGYQYEVTGPGGVEPGATEVTLAIEALNRAPFIWLIRVLMIGFMLCFGMLVWILWKGREEAAAGGVA